MGLWERIKAALGREAAEAKDLYDDTSRRLEADLDRRERELAETPQEKLERMTRELETQPDPFDDVKARLDRLREQPPPGQAAPDGGPPPPPTAPG
ncbi:MAG: hypothetical protein R2755_20570 [Acidimicrobiales bacterium]